MPKATPEDLINKVIAADALRRKAFGYRQPSYHPGQRVWIEPGFNFLGLVWGKLSGLFPRPLKKRYVQWVVRTMGGHPRESNPELKPSAEKTVRLAREILARTGQWPALLILQSHPETEGPLQWVRFELISQGIEVADAVNDAKPAAQGSRRHPRCLLAIDPFALDTVSAAVGGFYAAWMHQFNFAYDRQRSTQSWSQRHLFLRGSDYTRAGWKILRLLKSDVPVVMALGGGLPYNARLLYGAREFVQRLSPTRWLISKRAAQLELMDILIQPENGLWPAEQGVLPTGKRQSIALALAKWGIPLKDQEPLLNELAEEFKPPVPYRQRLFRILTQRLAARGKPIIVLPMAHQKSEPHIRLGNPLAIEKSTGNAESFGKILAPFFNDKI